MKPAKHAVAVLTRGYSELVNYSDLIQRNQAIQSKLGDIDVDLLFFHEGNISISDQKYIQDATPEMELVFCDISADAFLPDRECVKVYPPTMRWQMGYRHMCSFWFVDFWKYVVNYSQILRIDEDCIVDFPIDGLFAKLDTKVALYGKWWFKDGDSVVAGINPLTLWFFKRKNQKREPRVVGGPYTNVIALNLDRLRSIPDLDSYIKLIEESGGIYSHRWGDLPLWGEVLAYFCDAESHRVDNEIKYYHGSHDMPVNI